MSKKCIAPKEIQEGDLLTYMAGEASAQVKAHIVACDYCQSEVASLQVMNGLLATTFYRRECPDVELLLQYETGLLSPAEAQLIRAHLAGCNDCQAEVAQITAVSAPAGSGKTWDSLLRETGRRILEAMPQLRQGTAATVRGKNEPQSFRVEEYEIAISIDTMYGLNNRWEIEGQLMLLRDSFTTFSGKANILQKEEIVAEDELDEFGYFKLENIKNGRYALQIELDNVTLSIKELNLS